MRGPKQSTNSALPRSSPSVLNRAGRGASGASEKKLVASGYDANAASSRESDAVQRSEPDSRAGSSHRVPSRTRPSALGMAYARGAQRMRAKQAQGALQSDHEKPLFVLELVVRIACAAFQNAWREVCAVRACSLQLRDICSEDHIWEQLFKLRWPQQTIAPTQQHYSGWRKAFLTRLRRVQASFLARNMPTLVQKNRRRDGFPDLRKVYEALRMSFSLSISQGSKSQQFFFKADTSIQLFESALCLRCTFSSQLRHPLHFHLRGRSSAVGKEELILTSSLQKPQDWQEASSEGDCKFLRSPCGRLFLAFWSDNTLAGMYVTLHYAQILCPVLGESEAWALLAARPQPDDLDSCLGLHDYTVALSLRSAKLECFSNTFYKVHLFGLGSSTNKSGFGGVVVDSRSCVEQRHAPSAASARPVSRHQRSDKAYHEEVCHFEVLAPHDSGVQPPFPCTRPPQITFQTAAFKSILQNHTFMDVTVFDEHGHIFWAASAVCQATEVCPHESSMERYVQVDFDRSTSAGSRPVQWLCLADRGAAQVLVQLEYDCSTSTIGDSGKRQPVPRVNAVTLHPEVGFLDEWWGSRHWPKHAKHKIDHGPERSDP
ncbi:unnamed protein product [Cladocopium goreaui]|uniref:F-box protein n=1 Tax=Cladocopium goreaui TaxID=2562237 RepID=A0A9P1C5D6_9DINO|nr:unnamed protein product [Cladocopium goreaui]|mmetsp:Transcript_13680/g.30225  ORF Transcript_13680/g.30225 Transcript_13680/m.30225 type:complete len:602 (-) Transcript_13680:113-1918(-)